MGTWCAGLGRDGGDGDGDGDAFGTGRVFGVEAERRGRNLTRAERRFFVVVGEEKRDVRVGNGVDKRLARDKSMVDKRRKISWTKPKRAPYCKSVARVLLWYRWCWCLVHEQAGGSVSKWVRR